MTEKKTAVTTDMVRELAELLVDKDLNEIDVKDKDIRIRISRGAQGVAMPQMIAPSMPPQAASVDVPAAPEKASNKNAVPSPMVGTVYLSPAPDAAQYVSVGSSINKGDTILIIEAMKTMNHIVAPRSGTVTSLLVEDKQPVEYGEALVIIE